ncbi:glycosyltransferase family 2 protein [Methanosarcina sp.]|uniref:glycosyltransferase family 2 protein n=1 Tax=Methanosarcina sp. TaxID=2213 RepID=UPI003C7851B6
MENKKRIRSLKCDNLRKIKNKRIKEIHLAISLHTSTKFTSLKSKLLPQNTRRREIYNFARCSAETLKHEGLEIFVHQVRNRTCERYIKSSKVPVFETKITQPNNALSLDKTLQGSFVFPANHLNKINIFAIVFQRKNSKIKLQIIDEKETVVRAVTVKDSKIKNNGYTSFKFKPIKESKDKLFYFKLSSVEKTSASVWYNDTEEARELTLLYNDATLNGNIGFQAFSNLGIQCEYDLWILRNNLTAIKKQQCIDEGQNFEYKPKISIIMPVYNVDKLWLEKAIDSVRNQLYTNWELCIADDASTKNHIKPTLSKYSGIDSRIKIKYLDKNLGISGASNEALSLATGEFIGLLDNDDELSADSLYEIIKLLNKKPKTDFVYSDEDKIDLEGKRCRPFFKPGWSPDLLISTNYICHFAVIRRKIVEEVGKFRLGFEGSQDHDLFLRVAEKTNKVEHIPKILYHWRMIPGSTALSTNSKDYARINGVKALQDHLKRQKIEGAIFDNLYRTNYLVDYTIKGDPLVSIIIHFNDNIRYIKECISSIIQNEGKTRYEILLLVANRSEESPISIPDSIKNSPNVRIITHESSLNASAISNFAAEKASGDYLLFLSGKIRVATNNLLSYLLMNAQREEIGCVGPRILSLDDTIKSAGIVFGTNGEKCDVFSGIPENAWTNFGLGTWSRNYLGISRECLMINKDKFFQTGGFNKSLRNNEDIDLCLRVQKNGYRNLLTGTTYVYSYKRYSRKEENSRKELQEILRSYRYLENGDPYYNPNLSLEESLCKLNLIY